MSIAIKKYLPLSILVLGLGLFIYFHLYRYLNLSNLKAYQASAQNWTQANYKEAVGLYLLIFVLLVACAIPSATILSLIGGFLFGNIAFFYAMFGTTFGGFLLFLAVRLAFGKHTFKKPAAWLKQMEAGVKKNAFNYLLMMRLVPVFPCWFSNVGAGLLNVRSRTFLSATILGIIPSTYIYVLAGKGLDKLIIGHSYYEILLHPSVLLPLLGLVILSIIPVIYKYVNK